MQKIVLITAVLSLLISGSAYAFSDVNEDHANYAAINYLEDKNVLGGYPDGTFKPDNPINRVEILKILMLGSEVFIPKTWDDTTFSDTYSDQWYAPYLIGAVDEGIVAGYPDGTYKPLQTVNHAEALKMLLETDFKVNNKIPTTVAYSSGPYNDTTDEQWYNWYFWAAKKLNLIGPDQLGNVYPGKELTRGDLAELMYRMAWLNEKNEMQNLFELPNLASFRTEIELNSLDVDNDSDKIDFDAGLDGIAFPSSDIWLGSLSINGNWTRAVDWWVIDMTKLPEYEGMEMTEVFDAIKTCPEEGYSSIDNPDEDGFGEPRRAYSGAVFCLRTNEFNYAKVEIIDAYSENFGDDKYMKLRYIYRLDGSRELP